ncbi:hypothetical protein HPB50_013007 [Hyalomma asiaticum]|uniref:Uncharacterized protein n=1 Tax=Hyalomma asiaticum TaxID=266040 RepID=A0ACB7S8F4_HYAAI|nr:hypothetical protein HPB50_013007 [Hyalomma asiaticum]
MARNSRTGATGAETTKAQRGESVCYEDAARKGNFLAFEPLHTVERKNVLGRLYDYDDDGARGAGRKWLVSERRVRKCRHRGANGFRHRPFFLLLLFLLDTGVVYSRAAS